MFLNRAKLGRSKWALAHLWHIFRRNYFWNLCPSIRRLVRPSISLSVRPSLVCPSVICLSVRRSVRLSVGLSVRRSVEYGCFLSDSEVVGSDVPSGTTEIPFFLTFAVPTAFRDPFFLVPREFLHAYRLFHWVPYKEMTCLGASMSKKH